ncbi:hypothetical protein [Dysgonomonas massiliensis]|uniref:hypothetical protein n=1 Tax=Dysgonomonas massiliensis TaxID=2040292 RepID=UPI00135B25A3|nr:hypothetical protein [Dysgonomonas massiliensis]
MLQELLLLKEAYENRLIQVNRSITNDFDKEYNARMEAKAACYRTFIAELNRVISKV